jgi:5-formyltetrahydrofolate cyclo-ligase
MADKFQGILRNTLKRVRKSLSPGYQRSCSYRVCSQIRKLEQYRAAKHIAFYIAFNGEICLDQLWKSAPLHGKHCYFPVLNDDGSLCFLPAKPQTAFVKNKYGIPEPQIDKKLAIELNAIDIVFFPLVGFDNQGNRIGMGAGYYDKTFANHRHPLLLGIAYEFQRQEYILPKEWDVNLDAIVTEKTVYWSNQ